MSEVLTSLGQQNEDKIEEDKQKRVIQIIVNMKELDTENNQSRQNVNRISAPKNFFVLFVKIGQHIILFRNRYCLLLME